MTIIQPWQTKESQYIVQNRWLRLRADTCVTASGHTIAPYYVLEYNDWVNCLVIDSKAQVLMLQHYRHAIGKVLPELVGGVMEKNESAKQTILRELKEELGYIGGELHETGVSYPNAAHQTNKVYSFIAIGGERTQEQTLEPGEDLEVTPISFEQLLKDVTSGANTYQSTHLLAVFFGIEFIKQSSHPVAKKLHKYL